jgi:hypothetical protein
MLRHRCCNRQRLRSIREELQQLSIVADVITVISEYARQRMMVVLEKGSERVAVYDPAEHVWMEADMTLAHRGAVAVVRDQLCVYTDTGDWTYAPGEYVARSLPSRACRLMPWDAIALGDWVFLTYAQGVIHRFQPTPREEEQRWQDASRQRRLDLESASAVGICNGVLYGVFARGSSLHRYDGSSRQWSECLPLDCTRWACALVGAEDNDQLYVCGGWDIEDRSTCQRYSPRDNSLTPIGCMLERQYYPAGVYIDGHVLLCGRDSTVAQRYDPRTDQWSLLPPLPRCCSSTSVVAW